MPIKNLKSRKIEIPRFNVFAVKAFKYPNGSIGHTPLGVQNNRDEPLTRYRAQQMVDRLILKEGSPRAYAIQSDL